MTEDEIFKKCCRVFYRAARVMGMKPQDASAYCNREAAALWPEVHNKKCREWYHKTQTKVASGDIDAIRAMAVRNLASSRSRARREGGKALSISVEALVQEMLKTVCACCGVETNDKCADHCHITGKFRGMLCQSCNIAEGILKTASRALQLATYMAKHSPPASEGLSI